MRSYTETCLGVGNEKNKMPWLGDFYKVRRKFRIASGSFGQAVRSLSCHPTDKAAMCSHRSWTLTCSRTPWNLWSRSLRIQAGGCCVQISSNPHHLSQKKYHGAITHLWTPLVVWAGDACCQAWRRIRLMSDLVGAMRHHRLRLQPSATCPFRARFIRLVNDHISADQVVECFLHQCLWYPHAIGFAIGCGFPWLFPMVSHRDHWILAQDCAGGWLHSYPEGAAVDQGPSRRSRRVKSVRDTDRETPI